MLLFLLSSSSCTSANCNRPRSILGGIDPRNHLSAPVARSCVYTGQLKLHFCGPGQARRRQDAADRRAAPRLRHRGRLRHPARRAAWTPRSSWPPRATACGPERGQPETWAGPFHPEEQIERGGFHGAWENDAGGYIWKGRKSGAEDAKGVSKKPVFTRNPANLSAAHLRAGTSVPKSGLASNILSW